MFNVWGTNVALGKLLGRDAGMALGNGPLTGLALGAVGTAASAASSGDSLWNQVMWMPTATASAVVDASGRSGITTNTGVTVGTTPSLIQGSYNMIFVGPSAYNLRSTLGTAIGTSDFTTEACVYLTGTGYSGSDALLNVQSSTNSANGFMTAVTESTKTLYVAVGGSSVEIGRASCRERVCQYV